MVKLVLMYWVDHLEILEEEPNCVTINIEIVDLASLQPYVADYVHRFNTPTNSAIGGRCFGCKILATSRETKVQTTSEC